MCVDIIDYWNSYLIVNIFYHQKILKTIFQKDFKYYVIVVMMQITSMENVLLKINRIN